MSDVELAIIDDEQCYLDYLKKELAEHKPEIIGTTTQSLVDFVIEREIEKVKKMILIIDTIFFSEILDERYRSKSDYPEKDLQKVINFFKYNFLIFYTKYTKSELETILSENEWRCNYDIVEKRINQGALSLSCGHFVNTEHKEIALIIKNIK